MTLERLTPADKRLFLICALVTAVSLFVGLKYYDEAFPEASIDFRVTRHTSLPIAEAFLTRHKLDRTDYRHAAVFGYDDEQKTFLERELVFGALVLVPDELRQLPADELQRLRREFTPAKFRALAEPGYAKAVMNFRLEDEGGGWTRLVTETRIVATDDHARRRFAAYWRTIYPGSALIRRMWLRAIRARAEARGSS